MFKFYRDGSDRPRDNVIGHDRFCQQRIVVPRYRRRRAPRRTQAEVDSAFELASMPTALVGGGSEDSSIYNSATMVCKNLTDSKINTENPIGKISNSQETTCPASTPSTVQFHHSISGGYLQYNYSERETSTCSITRFFSSIAATLTCRQNRKTSVKYDPNTDTSGSLQFEYSRLGDEAINSSIMELDEAFIDLSPGIIRLEKAAAHRICMKYLESTKGRYVLIDHLLDIGWRTNRLWYLVSDSTVRAERLLTITPCNPKSHCVNYESVKTIIEACHALRHPYVCPILDLKLVEADAFGKQFVIVVTPVVELGSLRDIFHRSQWTDRWGLKYNVMSKAGVGLTEIQIQRLSCHILEALLELRFKGLPAGLIGYHLHSGNVLVQHGTARFSALDNILFSHQPKKLPFITQEGQMNPEAIDSLSFAYMLFSMCSGYETTSELTLSNWTDIQDYEQVVEVMEYILNNPENQIPTLYEISKLDFYRTLDLRELRAPPPPSSSLISGPPVTAVHFFVACLRSNRIKRAQKSKSICEIMTMGENRGQTQLQEMSTEEVEGMTLVKRPYSSSTPSIPNLVDENKKSSASSVSPPQSSTPPLDIASIPATAHSSQLSVYWTPPNSITFQVEPSASLGELKTDT